MKYENKDTELAVLKYELEYQREREEERKKHRREALKWVGWAATGFVIGFYFKACTWIGW